MGVVTGAHVLAAIWLVVVGLSILTLAAALISGIAIGIGTVRASARRARVRAANCRDLGGAFPERTLTEIDEALERALLTTTYGRSHRRTA